VAKLKKGTTMKKALLGSTLLAAGLMAWPAHAQLDLTISGSVDVHAGFASEDLDTGRRAYGITTDTTLNFDADGVADNGLEYGLRINVDDDGNAFEIDETWVFVSGEFGEIRMGGTDPAASELRFHIPTVGNGQADGDFGRYVNDVTTGDLGFSFGTDFEYGGDDNKIVYIGEFGDVTVGASYSPTSAAGGSEPAQEEDGSVIVIDPLIPGVVDIAFQLEDAISLGANYQGDLNNVALGVSAGANFADVEPGIAAVSGVPLGTFAGGDLTEYGVGVEAGFGAVTVGGFWLTSEFDIEGLDIETDRYGGGVTFTTGPWGFAANALLSDRDFGGVLDSEDVVYGVGVEHSLADGLTPYADLVFFDHDGVDPAVDNDGSVFLVGITASF
jgi:hypothetical protein